jgi:hypothetical protein
MNEDQAPTNLEEMLDRLGRIPANNDRIALGTVLATVGRRSFAPLLLVAGLIAFSPLSGIPGVPTLVALMVVLIAGQLFFKRRHFWLPQWLLRRQISTAKYEIGLKALRRPARFIDRFLRPRLTALTQDAGLYAIAVLCVLIAATMPPMELVPFAATSAGAALTVFALSLIAHDGLVALLALILTSTTAVLVLSSFVS